MPEPVDLPKLDDANALKLAALFVANSYTPNGLQCPVAPAELYDVPNSETKAAVNGITVASIKVVCAVCGFKGERYL